MAAPSDIDAGCLIFDLAFHPHQDVLAVGLVSGQLEIYGYAPGSTKKLVSIKHHEESLRSLSFSADGQRLYTGGSDRYVKAVDPSGTTVWAKAKAHKAPVNVVRCFAGHMIASGDDDGGVKLWDSRVPSSEAAPVAFKEHDDVVTDIVIDESRATLLSSSGDGRLGVVDLRKSAFKAKTEQEDDELLSLAIIKDGATVVAGSQDGALLSYKWGKWAYKDGDADTYGPDKFRGHPQSIDSILPVDADTLVTGSSDGIIRLVTVAPNKLVGVLGEHSEDPIERLAFDRSRRLLASASHDNTVKFWDVGYLYEADDEGGEEEEEGEGAAASSSSGSGKRKSKFTSLPALQLPSGGGGDDDDDDDEDDSMDDEDDSDEDEDDDEEDMGGSSSAANRSGAGGRGRLQPIAAVRGPAKNAKGKGAAKGKGGSAAKDFFDDL